MLKTARRRFSSDRAIRDYARDIWRVRRGGRPSPAARALREKRSARDTLCAMRASRRRLGAAGSGEVMAARFRALWRHMASPWRRGSVPLLPLAGLMLLVLLALGWALWAGTARIDEVQRASEGRLVGHAAKSLQQTLAQQAHDYTYWDDAVTNLTLVPGPK